MTCRAAGRAEKTAVYIGEVYIKWHGNGTGGKMSANPFPQKEEGGGVWGGGGVCVKKTSFVPCQQTRFAVQNHLFVALPALTLYFRIRCCERHFVYPPSERQRGTLM